MKPNPREMTVARLREAPGLDRVDVAFLESARFYKLRRDTSDFQRLLERLQHALESGSRVRITFAAGGSDIIDDVQDPR